MIVFKKLGWFFKMEWKRYAIGITMLVFIALLQLVPPQIIGRVIDALTTKTLTPEKLTLLLAVLLATGILTYGFRYLFRIFIFGASFNLGRTLRARLYKKYTSMSPPFFQRRRTGDLMAHATNDINAVQQTAGPGVFTIVDAMVMGGMILISMAVTVSPKLMLIAIIPLPLMVIITSYLGKLLNASFRKAQEAFSQLNDKAQESIAGIKVTKSFGYENEDHEDFVKLSNDVVQRNIRVTKIDAFFDPTIMLVVGASYFLSLYFGAHMVFNDEITIGQLVTFTTYLSMMIWPLLALGFFFNIVQKGRASYERIEEILNTESDIDVAFQTEAVPQGTITYDIDQFYYPGDEKPLLKDIRFQVEEGATIGIVGRTGSGKSTLIRLLLREFDTEKPGDITYGERPLRDYQLSKLRSKFGYVPQDHFLFSTTIRENIAFSNPDIDQAHIEAASRLSAIHDDITQFTDGYETVIGERGVSLSGGQKQRISIARALITDPDVLILDDSLSAVDAETESRILNNLHDERKGKTNIITAHRMSAISHADLIIVMDEGRIIERSTHETLMAEAGWYYETYQAQALQASLTHDLDDLVQGGEHDGTTRS
ncbi:multidrug ABC transporter permease/ATP-binding protein [Staphylococcus massiliensis CCUG 55927]|uniref:ABC transporter ATP-binding protein n=1 Tax=Staphylococcus massiliensis TaxID=555791 RepID=UPI000369CD75|nr:ABC transporter transmembrane domain-containing protein [Staphylococcus massiliensis]PNZ99646.1 multidrug ABC transporter permease/ATP-binding protein [Staphylococcus massiliensis CCUG 55927]